MAMNGSQSIIKSRKSRNVKSSLRRSEGMWKRRSLREGDYNEKIAAPPMARTAAAMPPILKLTRRETAEDAAAVGIGAEVPVLLGLESIVPDGLPTTVLTGLVVVVIRRETLELGVAAVDAPEETDDEETPPIENWADVAYISEMLPMLTACKV